MCTPDSWFLIYMHQAIASVLYATARKLSHKVYSFLFQQAVTECTTFQEYVRDPGYKNMSDVVFALKEYSNKGYRHVTNDYSVISAKVSVWYRRYPITEKYLNKVRD